MASVLALHRSVDYSFSKQRADVVDLIAGVGVCGDVHAGPLVRHRGRVATDPTQPNLRQIHLIESQLFEVLSDAGFHVGPGDLGENVTTEGIDLHALAVGSVLRLGESALVAVTGLRNPCAQIENFRTGLLRLLSSRGEDGALVRRAGIMGIVVYGGTVRTGDLVEWNSPPGPSRLLEPV